MKVTHDNINTFLYTPGKYFIIPDFQRPYSWDKANIISFIEDLEAVMTESKKHFFGSIVFINEGNNSTIIDGQQRATTVLLMLTAIYHIVTDNPFSGKISPEEIKEKYLYNRHDYTAESNRIKLRTVTTDNIIFEQIFERSSLNENTKNSKLYQAYLYFYDHFVNKNNLQDYVNALENFEVVTISLDATDDNPQKIFESINSTGKPLTDGDKIRNFALMLNNKTARETVLKKYWEKIERELTDVNKDYISDFFKFYLTSQLQKEVKLEQVYPEFKKLFNIKISDNQNDIQKLELFYDKVLAFLNHYIFVKFNRDETGLYQPISDKGFRLNYLKVETPYPFLLTVLEEFKQQTFDDNELNRIFTIIESYLARRIICDIPTTGLNKLFAILHKDIMNYKNEYPSVKYSEILGYILINRSGELRMPNDIDIKNSIKFNPIYTQRSHYVYFILSSIDDQSKESTLLKQLANGDIHLTIEHIMPQTLNSSWENMLGEKFEQVYQQYKDTLPNLTLTAYNSKYSNNDFATKKNIEHGFNDSPLLINQFIKNSEIWDQSALENRENWWFEQIEKIWPLPTTSFQPRNNETEFTFLQEDKDLTGKKVKAVIILRDRIECNNWALALENILKYFFILDEHLYDYIISDEYLRKYIKADKNALRTPKSIGNTIYYYENNTNTNTKRDVVFKLAEYLGLDKSDIKVILGENN